MKFDIDAEVLVRSLTSANLGLPKKTLTPILKSVLFEVKKSKLHIITTKGIQTVGVETEIELDYSTYRVIFDAEQLMKIARTASGTISFDCAPRKAIITSGKSSWTLSLQDATEYPEINSLNITSWSEVAREPFIEALSAVHQAASGDPQRPSLCAVNISDNEFTAADGMRLHRIRTDYAFPNCNVPAHAVVDILSLLKSNYGDEYFGIRAAKNGIAIKSGSVTMVVGALAEEYPDVSSALMKPTLLNEDIVPVEKTELLTAIQRCSVTSDDVGLLTLELAPGKLKLYTKDQMGSHSAEELDTFWDAEGKVKVNVRSWQLSAAVKSCPNQNIDLYFGREENSKLPSILLKCDAAQYAAVVTQVRTDLL